jgi:hypothetical protein
VTTDKQGHAGFSRISDCISLGNRSIKQMKFPATSVFSSGQTDVSYENVIFDQWNSLDIYVGKQLSLEATDI